MLVRISSLFGEAAIRDIGAALDEPAPGFDIALRVALPALLLGAVRTASTVTGAADLYRVATDPDVDAEIGERIAAFSAAPQDLRQALQHGRDVLSLLLGSGARDAVAAIAAITGASASSTSNALAMGATTILSELKAEIAHRGLSASGLASLLTSQRDPLSRDRIDRRVLAALGWDQTDAPQASAERRDANAASVRRVKEPLWLPGRRRWWFAAVALGGVLVSLILLPRLNGSAAIEIGQAATPVKTAILRTEETGIAPAMNLTFVSGAARLDTESQTAIRAVAEAALDVQVQVLVRGYSANLDAAGVLQLTRERIAIVRDALIDEGMRVADVLVMPCGREPAQNSAADEGVEISLLR